MNQISDKDLKRFVGDQRLLEISQTARIILNEGKMLQKRSGMIGPDVTVSEEEYRIAEQLYTDIYFHSLRAAIFRNTIERAAALDAARVAEEIAAASSGDANKTQSS